MVPRWQSLPCKHRTGVRRTGESFAGYCRGTRFYSIRFEYVRAERAGNRRLREHEFTLLSGLMARISLCRGLCECKLEEAGRDRRDGGMGQSVIRAARSTDLDCKTVVPANLRRRERYSWKYYHYAHYPVVYVGIMLINNAKSTRDSLRVSRRVRCPHPFREHLLSDHNRNRGSIRYLGESVACVKLPALICRRSFLNNCHLS